MTPPSDWAEVEYYVVGARVPVPGSTERRSCARCGQDVFTRDGPYPATVPVVCEVCFVALLEEVPAPLPANPDELGDAQLVRLCYAHGIVGVLPYSQLEAEAVHRGVDLRTVAREYLVHRLEKAGIL